MTRKGDDAARFSVFAELALPIPLPRTFSYGVPETLRRAEPGVRARARFGRRVLVGCVTRITSTPPELPEGTTLQPLLSLLDDEPVLASEQLELAEWIADYYLASPGLVCRSMLPPETPRGETIQYQRVAGATASGAGGRLLDVLERPMTARAAAKALGKKSVSGTLATLVRDNSVEILRRTAKGGGRRIRVATITEQGRQALDEDTLHPTTSRILTLLSVATDPVPVGTIRNELDIARGPFASLVSRELITLDEETLAETPWHRLKGAAKDARPELTDAQDQVVQSIRDALTSRAFKPFVLHGVTGSGKTEVYMRVAETVLACGRNVLILVPEIALTPRLAALLHARFGERVAILHSALGSGERRDEWWRIRHGEAAVVVGARAAVLAPVDNLGLVVVDEEHEGSYKQEERPRYNARDVAIVRAKNDGAVVLLGSATPSLESYTHATAGRYGLLTLSERIASRPLAAVELIDMKEVVTSEGPDVVLSSAIRDAIEDRLEAKEQALVLLNRRGYAGQMVCRQCGLSLVCTDCSVSMTLHKRGTLAVCHYCGLGRPAPTKCETCDGEYLRRVGYGTERLEAIVRESFPKAAVERMDRDTMRAKGSYEALLSRFGERKIDILVGTQMLAKGHDFPDVTLVGVLGADNGLGAPDFRAAERTFQLMTQVAGRAGRGERPGEVFIQTFTPEHYSLQFAQAQDYLGFYETERKYRRALLYPPALSLINVIIEGSSTAEASREARRAAAYLNREPIDGVRILGPAFAVRSKVAKRFRTQILIKLRKSEHARVRHLLRGLLRDDALSRVMHVDIDPMTLS